MTGDDDLVRILDADAVAAAEMDPLRQSGFFGDARTWEAHRRPMLHAVDRDGSFLDVGCASGYLLECLVQWAAEAGHVLQPFGVDVGPQLVELAKRRLPHWADRFFVGDAREWTPPMRFDFVCTTAYPDFSGDRRPHFEKLIREYAAPGGRLILRTYFTVTGTDVWNSYFDNAAFLTAQGFEPSGSSASDPVGAEYVWIDL